MSAAPRGGFSRAGSEMRLASARSRGWHDRPGLHAVRRAGRSFAVAALVVWTVLSAASPASASPAPPSRPESIACGCVVPAAHDRAGAIVPGPGGAGVGGAASGPRQVDSGVRLGSDGASAAAAGGTPGSQSQPFPGNGNGGGENHGRGESGGVPQDEHPGLGNGNGQGRNSVAQTQPPVVPGVGNGHESSGGAPHGQGGDHANRGEGGPGRPGRAAGSDHGNPTASAQAQRAAALATPPSPSVTTTPAAGAFASEAPTPQGAAGGSPLSAGQNAQALTPRVSRPGSRSAQSAVRTRARANRSRRATQLTARVEAGAPGARAGVAAVAGVSASSARDTGSGGPSSGRIQSHPRLAGGAGASGGDGFLSVPLALPRTIERLVRVVPTAVWLALLAAVGLAAAAALAAILAGLRGRRQARAIAAAEQIAATDPLTGVLNRRGFGEAVERELARARRHDHPFALAYLDVRGLKAVNDGEGHLVGDELIRHVAGLLRDCARAGDVIGRLGGDEFGLLLAEQSAEGAAIVRRRLQAQLSARRAAIDTDLPWDLTVGTAAYPDDGGSFETLLSVADRRLYAQRGIQLRAGTRGAHTGSDR